MAKYDPSLQCALDGYDWGNISGAIYCSLAAAYGPALPPPFISAPPGICSTNFEPLCHYSYSYVSGNAPLPVTPPPPMTVWPYTDPVDLACQKYTVDSGFGLYATIFGENRDFDCTYEFQ